MSLSVMCPLKKNQKCNDQISCLKRKKLDKLFDVRSNEKSKQFFFKWQEKGVSLIKELYRGKYRNFIFIFLSLTPREF